MARLSDQQPTDTLRLKQEKKKLEKDRRRYIQGRRAEVEGEATASVQASAASRELLHGLE